MRALLLCAIVLGCVAMSSATATTELQKKCVRGAPQRAAVAAARLNAPLRRIRVEALELENKRLELQQRCVRAETAWRRVGHRR